MAVGVKSQKVAKCLHRYNGSGHGILFPAKDRIFDWDHCREKFLQGFPPAATQIGKQFSIVKKISAKEFRSAEDKMPVWNPLQEIFTKPLANFTTRFW